MTLKTAKAIYIAAGGDEDHSDSEWVDIQREMEAVVAARTDRNAVRPILWWNCWDRQYTAVGFARRVRKAYSEHTTSVDTLLP